MMRGSRQKQMLFSFLMAIFFSALSGCSSKGDLGRHDPSLLTQVTSGALKKARRLIGRNESYDLPLTAAEDALRTRGIDLQALQYNGIVSRIDRAPGNDGFAYVEAMTQDLGVERGRFALFVEAASRVMQIDGARAKRLAGLDSVTARAQLGAVKRRAGENEMLVRDGVRQMRERSTIYKKAIARLPVEWPQVPLLELETAYEDFNEDVVRFHARIDQQSYLRLGAGITRKSYK